MFSIRGRRIGSAHVIAFVALVLALTGSAVALPGKNNVDKNDIKKNAVNSADIKNGSVTGTDVKNGSLGGSDVNEATLGQVPSAATAATTSQIVNVFYTGKEGDATRTILSLGGLTLTEKCESSNEIYATTSVSNSLIDFNTGQDNDYNYDEDFDVGDEFDADDGHSEGQTEMFYLHYTRPDGINVIVTLHDVDAEELIPAFPGSPQEADCLVAGIATIAQP